MNRNLLQVRHATKKVCFLESPCPKRTVLGSSNWGTITAATVYDSGTGRVIWTGPLRNPIGQTTVRTLERLEHHRETRYRLSTPVGNEVYQSQFSISDYESTWGYINDHYREAYQMHIEAVERHARQSQPTPAAAPDQESVFPASRRGL